MRKKKLLVTLGLFLALISLTACLPFPFHHVERKQSSSSSSSSSQASKLISESYFKKLAQVEPKAVKDKEPADPKQKSYKLASAPNGFSKTDGAGNELIDWRYYDIPDSWSLNYADTKDKDRDVSFYANEENPKIVALLYTLNAYDKSPFYDGKHYSESDLDRLVEQDQQKFDYKTTVTIKDKTWHVGITNSEKYKTAQLSFYYLENTGSFTDSILVGTLMFSLDTDAKDFNKNLETNVAYLKDILEQVTHKVEAQP